MSRWSQEDVDRLNAKRGLVLPAHLPVKTPKYHNKRTDVDGITFDSTKEATHYLHLKMRVRLKEIDALELQPKFEIFIERNGERFHIGWFTPDFRYWEHTGDGAKLRVVDVKSDITKTTAYKLRKKLVEAIYGIVVTEV